MLKKMHYMDYLESAYVGRRKPCRNTIKKQVREGKINGVFENGTCYVLIETDVKIQPTSNELVNETLKQFGMLQGAA